MRIFDRYVFRNLAIATALVTVTLALVVFLSQSLRFLELVIDSGASSAAFWILTFLALPRFFEIIMPLSMMAATIFIYNRMTIDSELVAIRAAGFSPLALTRPALMVSGIVTVFLWCTTFWLAPQSVSGMYQMQGAIKSQVSALLFHEGVFNQAGPGLTVYIRDRTPEGELRGLMIYDERKKSSKPSVILAKRGALGTRDGQEVVVYDGSRQELDPRTGKLQKLNFERYTVSLPGNTSADDDHWKEADERTITELLNPDPNDKRDIDSAHEFRVEIHRRIAAPLLALAFTIMSCAGLLLGPMDRRGQGWRIIGCIAAGSLIQSLFLSSFSLARHSNLGLPLMYLLSVVPMGIALFLLYNDSGFAWARMRMPGSDAA